MSTAEQVPSIPGSQPEMLDRILEYRPEESKDYIGLEPVFGLHEHLEQELIHQDDYLERGVAASDLAGLYRDELVVDEQGLPRVQRSALALSRLYLSNVGALGYLREYIVATKWLHRKTPEVQASKIYYLDARKRLQDDVDGYFKQFERVVTPVANQTLLDVSNLARLLISKNKWVDASTDTNTHQFIGSILSERLVMLSLQRNVHPDARYGTPEEDSSPIKADVVVPFSDQDMHVQVKMKWKEPTQLGINPKRKRMHVTVPMHIIRSGLTQGESKQLKRAVNERLEEQAA